MVLEQARPDADLHARFDLGEGELSVTVAADGDVAARPDEAGFAWQVLTALTTRATAEVTDGSLNITLSMKSALLT